MKANHPSIIPEPTEMEIQHAAYLLWVESGKAPGHDLDHWLAAKELLRHRHGRAAGSKRLRSAVATVRAVPAPSSN